MIHFNARDPASLAHGDDLVDRQGASAQTAFLSAAEYDEITIPIESGDVFVFHSDGVTEAWNGKEEFGSARLASLVMKHGGKTSADIAKEMERTLRNWAKQHLANDDVTLVIVKVV